MKFSLERRGTFAAFIAIILWIIFFNLLFSSNNSQKESNIPEIDLVDLNDVFRIAVEAAENGGRALLASFNAEEDVVSTKSYINCIIRDTFTNIFPKIKIILEPQYNYRCTPFRSKASASVKLNFTSKQFVNINQVSIWFQSVDAPEDFMRKNLAPVTVMVCVVVKQEPLMGIIFSPSTNTTSWGWVGHGSSMGSPSPELYGKVRRFVKVVVPTEEFNGVAPLLRRIFGENVSIVWASGVGNKFLLVANDMVDAYIQTRALKIKNICAGSALIKASGGEVTSKSGLPIYYTPNSVLNQYSGGLVATLRNHDRFLPENGYTKRHWIF